MIHQLLDMRLKSYQHIHKKKEEKKKEPKKKKRKKNYDY